MRAILLNIALSGWAVIGCLTSFANPPSFTLANTIQSNMVVQQGKPFKVWGFAANGAGIGVQADWMPKPQQTTAAANGQWLTQIPVPKVKAGDFTPHAIRIWSGKDTVLLSNVLIGEVWLCGGQSNMDMELKPFYPWLRGVVNFEQEINNANYPAIRLYNVRTDFKSAPQADCINGAWKICTPDNAKDFSGVAYFFARELYQKLQLPVGMVVSSVGASSCQAWTSRAALEADHELKQQYLYPYDTSAVSKQVPDSVVTFEKVLYPTLFYNAMIHPLRNLSLSGFLWYQGESNRMERSSYTKLTAAMVKNWRGLFAQGDLPFYYVQVAPFKWEKDTTTTNYYGYFREAQDSIRLKSPNTGMVVTMDIGEADDLHPRNKQQVGIRLAKHALSKQYGKQMAWRGPEYKGMRIDGNTIKVMFQPGSTANGLRTNDDQPVLHFFVAGADKKFYPAKATVRGHEVWVQSAAVANPVAVRYAFNNYPVTNLCNSDGLPAAPFRSDKWPEHP